MDLTSALIGAGLGAGVTLFVLLVYAASRAGGLGSAGYGLTVAGRVKQDPVLAAKVKAVLDGTPVKPSAPPPPPKPSGTPLRMLALLQAEARLVDFLMEDIAGASDAQVGQAVREVHRKAQAALKQHAVIETILTGNEGDTTTVAVGFDPSAVRVIGNVAGRPPFTGQIQHPGWRVKEIKLAAPPQGADEFILQPAEVQIP